MGIAGDNLNRAHLAEQKGCLSPLALPHLTLDEHYPGKNHRGPFSGDIRRTTYPCAEAEGHRRSDHMDALADIDCGGDSDHGDRSAKLLVCVFVMFNFWLKSDINCLARDGRYRNINCYRTCLKIGEGFPYIEIKSSL